MSLKDSASASSDVTDSLVKKQLLLSYLAEKARGDISITFSRQFHLAQWYNEEEEDSEEDHRGYYESLWNVNSTAQKVHS